MMLEILLPVIVGGLIAIGGGFASAVFLHRRHTKAEKRKLRAEKLEEFVTALYEHKHWLDKIRNIRVSGAPEIEPPTPFAKVQAICSIYFPQLQGKIKALDLAADKIEVWTWDAAHKRNQGDPTYANDAAAAYKPYGELFSPLIKELADFARREFQ
jgi:hypothetical protein